MVVIDLHALKMVREISTLDYILITPPSNLRGGPDAVGQSCGVGIAGGGWSELGGWELGVYALRRPGPVYSDT